MANDTFEKAIRQSMKLYWNKPEEFNKNASMKGRKYNKEYFDSMKPSKDKEEKKEY